MDTDPRRSIGIRPRTGAAWRFPRLQTGLLVASALSLTLAVVRPTTVGWVLSAVSLVAGVACITAALRLPRSVWVPWLLIGFGEICNGIGNVMIAADLGAWYDNVDWLSSVWFDGATFAFVVGLIGLVAPTAERGRLACVALDLIVITGSIVVLSAGWHFGTWVGDPSVPQNWIDVLMLITSILDVVGLAVGVVIWRCRGPRRRPAARLAVLSLLVASLGDAETVTRALHVPVDVIALSWVISALLLINAAPLISDRPLVPALDHRLLPIATLFELSAVFVAVGPGVLHPLIRMVMVVILVAMTARQAQFIRQVTQLYRQLDASERELRGLFESVRDVILRLDLSGRVRFASPSALAVLGRDPARLRDRVFVDLVHPDDRAVLSARLREPNCDRLAFRARREDGTDRYVEATWSRMPGGTLLLNLRDVDAQTRLQQQLQHAASTDRLTGLANRTRFEAALVERLETAGRATVMFCDLDRFKLVNDTSGHVAGDRLLVDVADRLAGAVDSEDLVGRFGGDEFTVLLRPGLAEDVALAAANTIKERVCGTYEVAGKPFTVGLSIGLAADRPGPAADVLSGADLALAAAKAQRGSTRVFDAAMLDDARQRVIMAERFRMALRNDELSLVFQPIVNAWTSRLVQAEALLRWYGADGRLVLPTPELIALAESAGAMSILGDWVLDRAVAAATRWAKQGIAAGVAVNIAGAQLAEADFARRVLWTLETHSMPPERLSLEITEDTLLEHSSTVLANLATLRERGVHLAIDDFGTGYSNFGYLHRLPVQQIKLDRSFVAGVDADTDQERICRAVTRLALELGLAVCAEGVERPAEMALLRTYGVQYLQGYLISRPMPESAFIQLVLEHRSPLILR
ncbi:putative bifunctional diguanylate cyclase/phosphodiesterase [Skermania piniformis]|uniref:Bifunctional diguanylate cyclase/phosphodiesterase n=1 Tax=Skermania pinensis TaxID=39122 RepID=A0ABX8S7J2_9ACTN|nr:bifunctional diguanylate cyclase/phosphodiesterase [Skermania piniformis]QXQ13792.1 bifunctional diguanylate cyclase/phosphodiesterase [Skermania piniformis]